MSAEDTDFYFASWKLFMQQKKEDDRGRRQQQQQVLQWSCW